MSAQEMLALGGVPAQPAPHDTEHPMALLGGVPAGPSAPREEPGSVEATWRSLLQGGTAGLADEATGLVQAATDSDPDAGFWDKYSKHRDESRAKYKAASEAHPYISAAGNLVGGVASAIGGGLGLGAAAKLVGLAPAAGAAVAEGAGILGGVAKAAPSAGSTVLNSALAGAGIGGAYGIGDSESDLTKGDFGGAIKDAGMSAATGAVAGPIMHYGVKGVSKIADEARQFVKGPVVEDLLQSMGVGARKIRNQGDGALYRATQSQSNLKNMLDPLSKANILEPTINELGTAQRAALENSKNSTLNNSGLISHLKNDAEFLKEKFKAPSSIAEAERLINMLDDLKLGKRYEVTDTGPAAALEKIQTRLKKLNAQADIDRANAPAEKLTYGKLAANPDAGIKEGEYVLNNRTGKPQNIGFTPKEESALVPGENGELVQKATIAEKVAAKAKELGLDAGDVIEQHSIEGTPLEQRAKLINSLEDKLNEGHPEKTFSLDEGKSADGSSIMYVKNNITGQRVGVPVLPEDMQPSVVKRTVRLNDLTPKELAKYQEQNQISKYAKPTMSTTGDTTPAQMQEIKDNLNTLGQYSETSLKDKDLVNLINHYIGRKGETQIRPVYTGAPETPSIPNLKTAQETAAPGLADINTKLHHLLNARSIGPSAAGVVNTQGEGKMAVKAGADFNEYLAEVAKVDPKLAAKLHNQLLDDADVVNSFANANKLGIHNGSINAYANSAANMLGRMYAGTGSPGQLVGAGIKAAGKGLNKGFQAFGSGVSANQVGSPIANGLLSTAGSYAQGASDTIKNVTGLGNQPVEYSNNNQSASYAKNPDALRQMSQKAALLGGNGAVLSKMLAAIAEKDDTGRNASMFALQQNPAYREMLQKLHE